MKSLDHIVILSGMRAARSAGRMESKDPYDLAGFRTAAGRSLRIV